MKSTPDLELTLEKFEVRVIVCDDDGGIREFGRIAYLDLLSLHGRKKGMMRYHFWVQGRPRVNQSV